jgi:hypothetical protein
MLFSANAEFAFPSTIAPTTGLPIPATGVSVTSVNSICPATGAASAASVSAVDVAATPTIGQKRRAF